MRKNIKISQNNISCIRDISLSQLKQSIMYHQHDTITKSLKSSNLDSDSLRHYTDKLSFHLEMWILLR